MFEGELECLVAPRSLLLHVSRTFSSVLYGFYRGIGIFGRTTFRCFCKTSYDFLNVFEFNDREHVN